MMARRQARRIRPKDLVMVGVLAAAALLVLFVGGMALNRWEKSRYAVADAGDYTANITEAPEPNEILYNGATYRQRTDLSTYLFIGVDNAGTAVTNDSYIGGGQGDVQMLLVVDDANRTWQVLQLNRDSMVDIPVLGVRGDVVGTAHEQLALAHSYGDGGRTSCENNVNTVSNLLNGQQIDGYMALNMDAVGVLTDLVGGVPITITSDFSAVAPALEEGSTVTLTGDEALTFVRSRKGVDDETNLARMKRQKQFIAALQSRLSDQDAAFSVQAYDALSEYMVTSIQSGTAEKIGERLKTYQELDWLTVDGNNTVENDHWAYYMDEDSLMTVILQLFYEVK